MIQGRPNQPAAARNPISPFPFPPGASRGGLVPPTSRTLPASKLRWQASMLRLPPQEGFQSAPLKSPLRDPPAGQAGFEPEKYLPDQRLVRYNRSCPE
jgi:hypothetical protein